jgi:hypothetical protein
MTPHAMIVRIWLPVLVVAGAFASLFVEAYLLIVLAAIAWLAFGSSPAVVAGAGVISGCVYIVTGIHSGACERSAIRS